MFTLKTHFSSWGGGGGVNSVVEVTVNIKEESLWRPRIRPQKLMPASRTVFEHKSAEHIPVEKFDSFMKTFRTSGFWPRVRARALRAPVFLVALPRLTGRCAQSPPIADSLHPPKNKNKIFQKQNVFLQARTRAARGIYFSTGLSCTLLSYAATYWASLHPLSCAAPY